MRGLLVDVEADKYTDGITPAHAGLTLFGFVSFTFVGDHPRACGAYKSGTCAVMS